MTAVPSADKFSAGGMRRASLGDRRDRKGRRPGRQKRRSTKESLAGQGVHAWPLAINQRSGSGASGASQSQGPEGHNGGGNAWASGRGPGSVGPRVRVRRLRAASPVEAQDGASAGVGDAGAAAGVKADCDRLDHGDDVADHGADGAMGQRDDQHAAGAVPAGIGDDEVAVRGQRQGERADQRIGIGGRILWRLDVVRRGVRRSGRAGHSGTNGHSGEAVRSGGGGVGGQRGEDHPAGGVGSINAARPSCRQAARQTPAAEAAEWFGVGDRALSGRAERDLGAVGEASRQRLASPAASRPRRRTGARAGRRGGAPVFVSRVRRVIISSAMAARGR